MRMNPATPRNNRMAASETPRIQPHRNPFPLHNRDNDNPILQYQSSGREIELDEIQQPTPEDYQYGRHADDFEPTEPLLHAGRQQVDEYFNETTTSSTRHDGDGDDIGIAFSPYEGDPLAAESAGSGEDNEAGDPISDTDFDYYPIPSSEAEALGYPRLDFKPSTLQNWFLLVTIAFFVSCIGAIVAMIDLQRRSTEGFHIHKTQNHLVFRYVPAAIGTLTTLWWGTVISALCRMNPYMVMAAQTTKHGHESKKLARTLGNVNDNNPMTWDAKSIRHDGHWLVLLSMITQGIIRILIVPLKASFLQIVADEEGWRVIVLLKVGYALISIYTALIIVAILLLIRLRGRDTGIKADPVSIADQLSLVQGSNVLRMFQGLEFAGLREYIDTLTQRGQKFGPMRLGYWKSRRDDSIWHGVACLSPPPGSEAFLDAAQSKMDLKRILQKDMHSNSADGLRFAEWPLDHRQRHVEGLEWIRWRNVNPLLTDEFLALFAVSGTIIIVLTIIGLASHRVQAGFDSDFENWTGVPYISRATSDQGISTFLGVQGISSFLEVLQFRFLPVEFFVLFGLIWVNADIFYRVMQPYAGMEDPSPVTENLLLDYPSCAPGIIFIKAVSNKHWRVALFSLLALLSTAPPILATGVFISTPSTNGYVISIAPLNFWACFGILGIYLICTFLVRPTPAYRMPRNVVGLGDVLSYCYASRVLDDLGPDQKPIFSAQDIGDERVHLESRIHLAKKQYQLGMYLGKDGKRHFGFDVAVRNDSSGKQVYVTKLDPGFGLRGLSGTWYWRRPKLVKDKA